MYALCFMKLIKNNLKTDVDTHKQMYQCLDLVY